jgi:AcrR family transcriptional regulator
VTGTHVPPQRAPSERATAKRPRDRKQQIVEQAAEQFRARGYHNVGMTDIADALGITGPALYRHFRAKQELLVAALERGVEQLESVYPRRYADLDEMLDAIAPTVLQRSHAGILWDREMRHIPTDDRRRLWQRYLDAVQPLHAAIARARPDLDDHDVELLMWATLAVFASTSYHATKIEPSRMRRQLTAAATAICRTPEIPLPRDVARRGLPASRGTLLPAARREAALTAAVRLFAERGYPAVGMDDIGAAANITGPSLYHHFPSKSAILIAALTRCLDAVLFDAAAAIDFAADAEHALDLVLRAFVRTNVEHGDAMRSLLHEMINVPSAEREAVRRLQHDYLSEWTGLVTAVRPELLSSEAAVLAHATHTVIGTLPRIRQVRSRPGLHDELIALGRATLGLTRTP